MNPKDPTRVLDEISSAKLRPDLELIPGITARIQQGKQTMKTRLRYTAILLVVVLLIACFSLPGVVSALRNMMGFIPGAGTVDRSAPLRVLAAPVTDTRDGYSLMVESALLDANRTVLTYRLTGDFPTWEDPSLEPQMCQEYPLLRLPDGSELTYPSREGGRGGGASTWKDVYRAMPAGVNSAVLVLPCLAELPAGKGPRNWEIPITFAPAPPELTVFPVVDLPTEVVEPSSSAAPTPAQVWEAATQTVGPSAGQPTATAESEYANWAQLTVKSVAVLDEGYYLQTELDWQKDPAILEVELLLDALHLYDAAGQEVSIWQPDMLSPWVPEENLSMPLNLQTAPILAPGPAKLVVDAVGVSMGSNTIFSIDVGDDPQPGQTWVVNKELDINGYTLRVDSAEYIQTPPGEPTMLMLYLSSDSGIHSVIAMDEERELMGTGGSPGSEFVPFRAGWRYKNGFPKGIVNVTITRITVRRPGPWSVEWTPPEK